MHTSRRLLFVSIQFMSFALGWIACGFVEVLQATSPVMFLACLAGLGLNMWALDTFVLADREEAIRTQRRLRR